MFGGRRGEDQLLFVPPAGGGHGAGEEVHLLVRRDLGGGGGLDDRAQGDDVLGQRGLRTPGEIEEQGGGGEIGPLAQRADGGVARGFVVGLHLGGEGVEWFLAGELRESAKEGDALGAGSFGERGEDRVGSAI